MLLDLFALTDFASSVGAGITTKSPLVVGAFQSVSSVLDGGPVQRAGIRAGDRIAVASSADARTLDAHIEGMVVRFVRPGGGVVRVTLARFPLQLNAALLVVNGVFLSLLALVLALRAWSDVQARRLAFGCAWLSVIFLQFRFGGTAQIVAGTVADTLTVVGIPTLIYFATGWEATPARLGRVLRRVGVIAAIPFAICSIPADILPLTPFANTLPSVLVAGKIAVLFTVIMGCALATGIIASVGRARGLERRKLGWISITLGITFVLWTAFSVFSSLGLAGDVPIWLAVTSFALPAGLAYAMLRHRLIDVGFALNRTAVFAATTALLVGLFGGLQWGADQLLVRATGTQGFLVQMTIAVVVLYVVRSLRTRTDLLVARLFFAARRRRIDAIASLARDVDAVESVDALPLLVVGQLRERAAIDAAIYVEMPETFLRVAGTLGPETVGRDAATVVTLRATRAAVPIRDEREMLGAIAFPLAVRGQLRGALVCALPDGDEEFAPDECDVLERLAQRVAIARDDLIAQALRLENAALRERLALLESGPRAQTRRSGPSTSSG